MVRVYNQKLAAYLMANGHNLISVENDFHNEGCRTFTFDADVRDIKHELKEFYSKKDD